MADEKEEQFPQVDKKSGLCIDKTIGQPAKYRVYFWAERPDADDHIEGDKEHWHPESEHETYEAAKARAKELAGGAKKKSILVHGTKH